MGIKYITECCRLFKEGRADVHDNEKNGWLSIVYDECMTNIEEPVRAKRRLILDKLNELFPHISPSFLGEIVTDILGYGKLGTKNTYT